MRALILSAGYGSRLGEIVKNNPKPLIEIDGKSVIERIIDRLHIHGVTQIIVNVHYLPTVISERIMSNALYYYEPRLLGHDGTIHALKDWLKDDDFFVINGDTISNVDYTQMMVTHQKNTISVLMDQWRCAGTWLYDRAIFFDKDLSVVPYRPLGLEWRDIGTPERLEEAKKYYE